MSHPLVRNVRQVMSHPLVRNVRADGCDVYVGRPSKWGNPFKHGTRESNISEYRAFLLGNPELMAAAKLELRGKTLGCWCAPKPCHADILAEVANS